MKRKLAGVLTAAVLMAQPFTSLAAGSMPSTPSPSRDNMSSSTQSMISGELNNGAAPTGTAGSSVAFSTDRAVYENAGFAWEVIEEINTINAGVEPLYRTIGTNNMVGYVPLAPVQAAVVSGSTTVTMYVPNLVEGLFARMLLLHRQQNSYHVWLLPPKVRIVLESRLTSVLSEEK